MVSPPIKSTLCCSARVKKPLENAANHSALTVGKVNAKVTDTYGNSWIDFTSSIFVANAGHSNPHIIKALRKQLDGKLLHSYTFLNEARIGLLEKLIKMSPANIEKN